MKNTELIAQLEIRDLFDLYTYFLPKGKSFSNAAILYGDNGVGKSTILRLVFHLLSASDKRGHRTALYYGEFKFLSVVLASGIKLTAERLQVENKKFLRLKIADKKSTLATWDYRPKREQDEYPLDLDRYEFKKLPDGRHQIIMVKPGPGKGKLQIPEGEDAYMAALRKHVPSVFILNADRRLDSDLVADPGDEVELRRLMRFDEPKRINDLVVRSREIALTQAMSAASRWLSQKAVIGANQGSTNVHSVYANVFKHLVSSGTKSKNADISSGIREIVTKLEIIQKMTKELSVYELTTPLSADPFLTGLDSKSAKNKELAIGLLRPYIESLEERLKALEPIYNLLHRFVTIINKFLNDKNIAFKLSQGFTIHNTKGTKLESSQLSSGEQQLLLLFCYVLVWREKPSVFIIDEPEISLNIKWQRELIQSLLDVTEGSQIQFLFASHSIELLAQHRNRVVQLKNGK